MITKWEYSLRTEALRLLHDANGIATGFFRLNQFYPLPYAKKTPGENNIVLIPDLPYLSIPRFWDRVAKIDISQLPGTNNSIPKDLVSQTETLLKTANLPIPKFTDLQKSWTKIENQVISTIYSLIPHARNSIKSITVWPTNFGTSCSFNVCDPKSKSHNIYIWQRQDQGIGSIVEGILSSLTFWDISEQLNGLWSETEIIVDWLLTFSPLSKLISVAPKTIKSIRKIQSASLLQQSRVFLTKIGVPMVTPHQLDTGSFSASERQLYNLLLSRSPNIVTFDELSASDPEHFSLYAISKSIQRLRDRLEKSGISGSFIQTKRGEGYMLVN